MYMCMILLLSYLMRNKCDFFKEQELCNRSVPMSPREKYFVGASLGESSTSSEVQAIGEAVGLLYPRTLKSISKKVDNGCLNDLLVKCSLDNDIAAQTNGKESLKSKCLSDLQRRMMFKHFSIAQLSYNMGKCGGSYVP